MTLIDDFTVTITTNDPNGDADSSNNTAMQDTTVLHNTPPVASNVGPVTGTEDQAARVAITLSGTDPDAGDAVESFTIESLPANGSLFDVANGGTALTVGAVIPATGSGPYTANVYFQPNADWNGR